MHPLPSSDEEEPGLIHMDLYKPALPLLAASRVSVEDEVHTLLALMK